MNLATLPSGPRALRPSGPRLLHPSRRPRHDGLHPAQNLTQAIARTAEIETDVTGAAEVGAVAETDTALFELGMRVLETEGGDIEPHQLSLIHI